MKYCDKILADSFIKFSKFPQKMWTSFLYIKKNQKNQHIHPGTHTNNQASNLSYTNATLSEHKLLVQVMGVRRY